MFLNAALSRREAARHLGVSPRTLDRLVAAGDGPAYVRAGARRMVFRLNDLDAWQAARRFQHRAAELTGKVAP
ncbi:MAG: helix-turn-helix transcriptional regulator [Acetobacteraceae bacterium]